MIEIFQNSFDDGRRERTFFLRQQNGKEIVNVLSKPHWHLNVLSHELPDVIMLSTLYLQRAMCIGQHLFFCQTQTNDAQCSCNIASLSPSSSSSSIYFHILCSSSLCWWHVASRLHCDSVESHSSNTLDVAPSDYTWKCLNENENENKNNNRFLFRVVSASIEKLDSLWWKHRIRTSILGNVASFRIIRFVRRHFHLQADSVTVHIVGSGLTEKVKLKSKKMEIGQQLNPPVQCRLCGNFGDHRFELFGSSSGRICSSLSEKIFRCLDIQVSSSCFIKSDSYRFHGILYSTISGHFNWSNYSNLHRMFEQTERLRSVSQDLPCDEPKHPNFN